MPDACLDLWALAVTAFVAATGKLPFDGERIEEVFTQVTADSLPVPSTFNAALSPAFDAWFARACAPDRDARFQSAAELSAALSAACLEAASGSGHPAPVRARSTSR